MFNRIRERMSLNSSRYSVIHEAHELLNMWRDFDDEEYRQRAIDLIKNAD